MSTLTYSDHAYAAPETVSEKEPRKSLWRRFVDGIILAQERRANREIARYLANHGGLLTDDMEREIMRRVMHPESRSI